MKSIILHKKIIYLSIIVLIILLSITYRFSLLENIAAQDISSVVENDTARYEVPALNYLEHGTFAINPTSPSTSTLHNQPGYALFIAMNYYLFGEDKHKLLKVQIIVSALSILLLSYATYLLWSWKASLLVATIMAIDPVQTLYSHVMLTETLQIFFICMVIVFAVLLLTRATKTYLWAFLLGLSLSFATYVHASHYYLIFPISVGIILFRKYLNWDRKKLLTTLLFLVLPAAILFSAWQIRNGQLTGVYQFGDNSSSTLYYYKASSVYAFNDNLTIDEAIEKVEREIGDNFSSLQARYDEEKRRGKEIILNNIGAFMKHAAQGYVPLLFGVGLDGYAIHYDPKYHANLPSGKSADTNQVIQYIENTTGKQFWYVTLVAYALLLLVATYALAILGYMHAIKNSAKEYRVIHFFLLGLALYYIVLATGHVDAYHRYRLASMSVVFLYAANGALLVLRHFFSAHYRQKIHPKEPLGYSY